MQVLIALFQRPSEWTSLHVAGVVMVAGGLIGIVLSILRKECPSIFSAVMMLSCPVCVLSTLVLVIQGNAFITALMVTVMPIGTFGMGMVFLMAGLRMTAPKRADRILDGKVCRNREERTTAGRE
jgi:Na+/citrate or Na+/malate symporter